MKTFNVHNNTYNLTIEGVPLEMGEEFLLCFAEATEKEKKYIADVYIKFKGVVIAHNWIETIEFFSFFDAFVKRGLISGHENAFFKVSQKDKINSLKFIFSEDEYFLSLPKVKTMLTAYNEFKSYNHFKDLIVSKKILSNEEARVTIFSSYMKEEKVKNEIKKYLKNNSDAKCTNYTLFDEETLKFYNMIKYAEENKEEEE